MTPDAPDLRQGFPTGRAGRGRRAVFLDRDGVINEAVVRAGRPVAAMSLSELRITPGVPEALSTLHEAGFLLIVVTNQPEIARGTLARQTVEAIHDHLRELLPIDEFRTCAHDDPDGCDCRKPAWGMLRAAAEKWGIDFGRSYMVGDRWRDLAAGRAAGCRTVFIDHGYDERRPDHWDLRVDSLPQAIPHMIGART